MLLTHGEVHGTRLSDHSDGVHDRGDVGKDLVKIDAEGIVFLGVSVDSR